RTLTLYLRQNIARGPNSYKSICDGPNMIRTCVRRALGEGAVERRGHPVELERVDEQDRVTDLPPGAAREEAPQLVLAGPAAPLGLLLHRPEGAEVPVRPEHRLDRLRSERADELALEVRIAGVDDRRHACAFERAPEALL